MWMAPGRQIGLALELGLQLELELGLQLRLELGLELGLGLAQSLALALVLALGLLRRRQRNFVLRGGRRIRPALRLDHQVQGQRLKWCHRKRRRIRSGQCIEDVRIGCLVP